MGTQSKLREDELREMLRAKREASEQSAGTARETAIRLSGATSGAASGRSASASAAAAPREATAVTAPARRSVTRKSAQTGDTAATIVPLLDRASVQPKKPAAAQTPELVRKPEKPALAVPDGAQTKAALPETAPKQTAQTVKADAGRSDAQSAPAYDPKRGGAEEQLKKAAEDAGLTVDAYLQRDLAQRASAAGYGDDVQRYMQDHPIERETPQATISSASTAGEEAEARVAGEAKALDDAVRRASDRDFAAIEAQTGLTREQVMALAPMTARGALGEATDAQVAEGARKLDEHSIGYYYKNGQKTREGNALQWAVKDAATVAGNVLTTAEDAFLAMAGLCDRITGVGGEASNLARQNAARKREAVNAYVQTSGTPFEKIGVDIVSSAASSITMAMAGGAIAAPLQAAAPISKAFGTLAKIARTSPFAAVNGLDKLEQIEARDGNGWQQAAAFGVGFMATTLSENLFEGAWYDRIGGKAAASVTLPGTLLSARFGSGLAFARDTLKTGVSEAFEDQFEKYVGELGVDLIAGQGLDAGKYAQMLRESPGEMALSALAGGLMNVGTLPSYAPSVMMAQEMASGRTPMTAEAVAQMAAQSYADMADPDMKAEAQETVRQARVGELTGDALLNGPTDAAVRETQFALNKASEGVEAATAAAQTVREQTEALRREAVSPERARGFPEIAQAMAAAVEEGGKADQRVTEAQGKLDKAQMKYGVAAGAQVEAARAQAAQRVEQDALDAQSKKLYANGKAGDMGAMNNPYPAKTAVSRFYENTLTNMPGSDGSKQVQDSAQLFGTTYTYDVITEKQSMGQAQMRLESDFDGEVDDLRTKGTWSSEDVDVAMGILAAYRAQGDETGDMNAYVEWSSQIQKRTTNTAQALHALAKYTRDPKTAAVLEGQRLAAKAEENATPKQKKRIEEDTAAIGAAVDQAAQAGNAAQADAAAQAGEAAQAGTGTQAGEGVETDTGTQTGAGAETDTGAEDVRAAAKGCVGAKGADSIAKAYERMMNGEISRAQFDQRVKEIVTERNGLPVFTEDMARQVNECLDLAEQETDEYRQRMYRAKAAHIVANAEGSTFKERYASFRRIMMLLNPKTLVKNATANVVFAPMEWVKDVFATPVDMLTSLATHERTTTADPRKLAAWGKGFGRGVAESAKDVRYGVDTKDAANGKYEISGKDVWHNRAMNALDHLVGYGLQSGDRPFYEAAYSERLRELELLGRDVTTPEIQQDAVNYALDRTFQANPALAKGLTLRREAVNTKCGGFPVGDLLLPFVQTPGNLADKLIDYSPAGLARALRQIGKSAKTGEFNQKLFVDRVGRSVTGTGLMILGYALSASGLLHGAGDNEKERQAMKNAGVQAYSLDLGNGLTVSVNWAEPLGTILLMGAAMEQSGIGSDGLSWANAAALGKDALHLGVNSFFNNTVLQNVTSLLSGYDAAGGIEDFLLGSTTQNAPSLLKALAQIADPYERDTYDPDKLKQAANRLMAYIPGLRNQLPQKIGTDGQPVQSNYGESAGERAVNSLINPAMNDRANDDPANNEVWRLFDEGKYTEQLFPAAEKKVNDRVLTAEERRAWQTASGTILHGTVGALLEDERYKALTDEERSALIGDAIGYARAMGKQAAGLDAGLEKWMEELNGDPAKVADAVLARREERLRAEQLKTEKDGLTGAIAAGDARTATESIQALRDMGYTDIRGYVTSAVKPQMRELAQDGRAEEAAALRETLLGLGLGYTDKDIDKWMK